MVMVLEQPGILSSYNTGLEIAQILRGTNEGYFSYGADMKLMKIRVITALLLTGFVFPVWAKDSEIQKHTQAFLDAHVGGDRQVILTLIDQENITMYGSDAAEIVHGSGALFKLVAADSNCGEGRPTSEQ
jgi:hypothetical protein